MLSSTYMKPGYMQEEMMKEQMFAVGKQWKLSLTQL